MHTIRWMPFGSITWHAVLVGNKGTLDKLVDLLMIDDEIEKLEVLDPGSNTALFKEWIKDGCIKWPKEN
jgi:hypothetical protein